MERAAESQQFFLFRSIAVIQTIDLKKAIACIDFNWEVLLNESMQMSAITHTDMKRFWELPWRLYEKAIEVAKDIGKKNGGG